MLTIERNNFKLELQFLGIATSSKPRYEYRFWDFEFRTEPLFRGADFEGSPCYEIESFETAAALLGFFALTLDDAEPEIFAHYNDVQNEWLSNWTERIEELKLLEYDIERWGDFAQELYNLSNDENSSFNKLPIALNHIAGKYKLYAGDLDKDDLVGDCSFTHITEGMSESECLATILNLYDDLED